MLHTKVNIVPVVAKADCLTKFEVQRLKRKVSVNQDLESFIVNKQHQYCTLYSLFLVTFYLMNHNPNIALFKIKK